MATELADLSIAELRALYARREVLPSDVVAEHIARAEDVGRGCNVLITETFERAASQAAECDQRLARREPVPNAALWGIPVTVKDLEATRGVRTTMGSLLHADWLPDFDAVVVERMAEAGAIVLGKTNVPEYGWKGDSGNRILGSTRNPWDRTRTAGGSSGGAGAATALGIGVVAQGGDGGGSIRIPAAFCGVTGFKPSFGRIPVTPPGMLWAQSCMGPLARNVADARTFVRAVEGPDPRDRFSLPLVADGQGLPAGGTGRCVRVAWMPRFGGAVPARDVMSSCSDAVQLLASLGHEVELIEPRLRDVWHHADVVWAAATAAQHGHDLERVAELLDPLRVELARRGAGISAVDVLVAQNELAVFCDELRAATDVYDLLVTPTVPCEAFAAGATAPPAYEHREDAYLVWCPYTWPFNISGQPAVSIPCRATPRGLPVGLQLVGRWRDDRTVLDVAEQLEAAATWPIPPYTIKGGDVGPLLGQPERPTY